MHRLNEPDGYTDRFFLYPFARLVYIFLNISFTEFHTVEVNIRINR